MIRRSAAGTPACRRPRTRRIAPRVRGARRRSAPSPTHASPGRKRDGYGQQHYLRVPPESFAAAARRCLAQDHFYGEDNKAYSADDKRHDCPELNKSPIVGRVMPSVGITNGFLPLFDGGRIVHTLTSFAQDSRIRFRQIALRCFDQRQIKGSACSRSAHQLSKSAVSTSVGNAPRGDPASI